MSKPVLNPLGDVIAAAAGDVFSIENADAFRAASSPRGIVIAADEPLDDAVLELVGLADIVALDFPKFADGRSYSKARLLKDRYGFKGVLRAVGDVLPDQVFFMKRCGFDEIVLADEIYLERAQAAFSRFTKTYQPDGIGSKPVYAEERS